MQRLKINLKITLYSTLVATVAGYPGASHGALLNLGQSPLFLGGNIDPNIMFTLDDSGSMQWELMPDTNMYPDRINRPSDRVNYVFPRASSVYGGSDYANTVVEFDPTNRHTAFMRSSHNNRIYYNPEVTYKPWSNADGTSFPNAVPTAAYHNPVDTGKGSRNLTTNNTQSADWLTSGGTFSSTSKTFYPATYFKYNGGDVNNPANYTKVEIKTTTPNYTGGPDRTDCVAAPTCTYAEEIQNFANWYTYYRSRILAARAGIGHAFTRQGTNLRVGFAAINEGSATIDGVNSPGAVIRGVRSFSGADRAAFFTSLYNHVIPAQGTPLRQALDDVGKYFERTDNRGPWGAVPGTDNTTAHLECRQNYNVLMTDGYWNGNAARTNTARENVDNSTGPTISRPTGASYQYTPNRPYQDDWGNPNPNGGTLADVAIYYWYRDLRPTLANKVPTNPVDPAFWQHLVNFTVGLGVDGTLNPATDLPALTAGTKSWPMPSSTADNENIDDLWHTAVNSRGEFFSAAEPDAFTDALSSILGTIAGRNGSAAAVAVNTGTLTTDSKVFQVRFSSDDWTGQVLAYPIRSDGIIDSTASWDAGQVLGTQDYNAGRNIVTYKPSLHDGVPFRWAQLDASQTSVLNKNPVYNTTDYKGADRVDYLRGKNVTGFRARTFKLGDIIHAAPFYVGKPPYMYPDEKPNGSSFESSAYSAFVAANDTEAERPPMIYVGANDGMLHGFRASDGQELMAYVPSKAYPHLNKLTSTTYTHRYFVNGEVFVGDAFVGSGWKSVLTGTLGGGGQGVFALDATNPNNFSEANAASLVLWEFTDEHDVDLGYTYGQAPVVKMQNGKWAAIFGNGYNNTEADGRPSNTGHAALYIAFIEGGLDGDWTDAGDFVKLTTKTGSTTTPNGLASPAPVDVDGDDVIDYIYAGDLLGNVWKFDVSSSTTSSWKVAYGDSTTPAPLFTAKDSSNNPLPITTRPEVGLHPAGKRGLMVYVGTGKYLETTDNSNTGQQTQSMFGIWDNGVTVSGRSDLLQQKILEEINQGFDTNGDGTSDITYRLRALSDYSIDWSSHKGWYLDLYNTQGNNTNNYGERAVTNPVLRNGKLVFTTLLPSTDPCEYGGDGWLMEVDPGNGGQLAFAPFDLNDDNRFTRYDYIQVNYDVNGDGQVNGQDVIPPGGQKMEAIPSAPTFVAGDGSGDPEIKYVSLSNGAVKPVKNNPGPGQEGRQSWRQLR